MGLSWVSHSTLIYTSELILCSHICVYSATRHNIHMYPNFSVAGYAVRRKWLKQDALGSVTGLHYDSKYFRIAKENGELCMVSGNLNITMICLVQLNNVIQWNSCKIEDGKIRKNPGLYLVYFCSMSEWDASPSQGYASVNSSGAHAPPPPGLTPGH